MRSNFRSAFIFLMAHECVFERGHYGDYARVICENVSGDRGGLTKFGIDQRSHPHIDIRALDYEQARSIYLNEEWGKCRCDDLPAGYDAAVFDIAVNNGKGTAILLLQRALNQIGTQPSLKEDAFIGPRTIAAALRGDPLGLERLLHLRDAHYHEIVENNPSQAKFLPGWMDRNRDLAATLNVTIEMSVPA